MKIILDINNKILKVLENERSIFKGEYGADKLTLLINKTLVNEYPVITGLLSNGRKIGPYTTDSSYGSEIIDGVTYTTAEFTLSKENGFTLTEGNTQVTIWIYKTSNSEVVSKTAIGNITFNVVNTTAFSEGDVIISGDEEGAFVNLKVEIENLQSVVNELNTDVNDLNTVVNELNTEVSNIGIIDMGTFATNRPIKEGLKEFFIAAENLNLDYYDNRVFIGLVDNIKVMAIGQAGGGLAVYTENFKQYTVGYDDADVLAVEYATSIIQLADVCSWDAAIDSNDMEAMLKGIANQLYQWYLANNINTYELGNEKSVVFTGRIYENPYIATFKVDDGFEVFIHCFGIWNYDTITYEVKDYYVRRGNEDNITVTDLTPYTKTEVDTKLDAKADKADTYTITEVDTKLSAKADTTSTYTKTEVDTRLSTKADLVDGKVPSSQLPSYVDDVVEVDTYTNLPSAGETGKIYVALDTNLTYRWSGSQYVEISPSLALGETSSTAYAGNKGKANADAISDLQDDVDTLSSNISNKVSKSSMYKYEEVLWIASDQLIGGGTLAPRNEDLETFLLGAKEFWTDIDVEKIMQYGYDRVIFLIVSGPTLCRAFVRLGNDGKYGIEVYAGIFKENVKELISLNTGKRYKIINDAYTGTLELNDYIEEIVSAGGGGVSEEDVMTIIESNAEQTDTLEIGTSATFDSTSDEQIPTSKAVSDYVASAGGGSKLYRHNHRVLFGNGADIILTTNFAIINKNENSSFNNLYEDCDINTVTPNKRYIYNFSATPKYINNKLYVVEEITCSGENQSLVAKVRIYTYSMIENELTTSSTTENMYPCASSVYSKEL